MSIPTPDEQAQLEKKYKENEARVLATLQSMAMLAVSLQQYAGEIAKFPNEVSSLHDKDMEMDSLLDWLTSGEEA